MEVDRWGEEHYVVFSPGHPRVRALLQANLWHAESRSARHVYPRVVSGAHGFVDYATVEGEWIY